MFRCACTARSRSRSAAAIALPSGVKSSVCDALSALPMTPMGAPSTAGASTGRCVNRQPWKPAASS